MASLRARHTTSCALGRSVETAAPQHPKKRVQGCTCQPRYSVRYRDDSGRNRFARIGDIDPGDGRPAFRDNDLTDARAALAAFEHGYDAGDRLPDLDHTFRTWADEWLTKRLRRPGKNTVRDYRATVAIANEVFGDKQLRKLSSRDVLDLLDRLDGRANNTQRKHLRNLNGCFESALRAGLIRRNPIAALGDAELPRAVKVAPTYFTDAELARLYAALERAEKGVRVCDEVYGVLVRTAVMTGLRKGELLELRWRDVDLVDGSLYVLRSWNEQTREVTTPKSGHGRTVDMIAPVVDLLARWKTDDDQPDDLVFPNPLGGRLVSKTVNRVLYAAMAAATDGDKPAPIPREGEHGRERDFHSLRHTFARKMLTGGAAIDWVKGQLGHSTITLTVDTYGGWDRAGKKAEAAKLAEAFA